MMEIRVLGSLEVVDGDELLELARLKHRELLVLLVIHAGTICSTDSLVDALWPESPPASATKLIQVYVSQLRKVLPPAAHIETLGAGYRLVVPEDAIDAARFERLVEAGREAWQEESGALAVTLYRRALALWRGRAYGDLADKGFVQLDAVRLEQARLVALEECVDVELALGRHAELLPELRSLAQAEPFRERVQAQAMLAHYRCGLQVDALDIYTALRTRMRNELGLEPSATLQDLQWRVLNQDPALAAAVHVKTANGTLPSFPNQLVGRDRELRELRQLIERHDVRLIVATGAGGSGKTRLAVEAARYSASSFADGATFVGLAPIQDPKLIVGAVFRALGLEEARTQPFEALVSELRRRELLLVLDNAEHLRSGSAVFVDLLSRCPRLTLLVTSRVVLHLSGEHIYPVTPLVLGSAVELFRQRAREAGVTTPLDQLDDDAVCRICERLDGLPLALELAASRLRTLTPGELRDQLERCLPLLGNGPRDLPARQQTLRSTLDWSYEQLTQDEQCHLRRLSVFVGGFTLQAARAVCGTDLDALTVLVDHSLLAHIPDVSGSRYTMLETIREYATERLEASSDAAAIRRRHAEHFLEVVQSANLDAGRLSAKGQRPEIAAREQHNARAALTWTLASGSIELGLRLTVAMDMFWTSHEAREGMRWFAALLGHPNAESADPETRAHSLRAYAAATDLAGDDSAAERLYEQSLSAFEQLGDQHDRAVLLHRLGIQAMRRNDVERARELVDKAHRIYVEHSDRWGLVQTIGTFGAIARDCLDYEKAAHYMATSSDLAHDLGFSWWEAGMLAERAALALNAGRLDEGQSLATRALLLARELSDRPATVFGIGLLACAAALRGEASRALTLWRAISREDAVAPLGGWRRHRAACEAMIRGAIDAPLDRSRSDSGPLSLDEGVTLALNQLPTTGSPVRSHTRQGSTQRTPAEAPEHPGELNRQRRDQGPAVDRLRVRRSGPAVPEPPTNGSGRRRTGG